MKQNNYDYIKDEFSNIFKDKRRRTWIILEKIKINII